MSEAPPQVEPRRDRSLRFVALALPLLAGLFGCEFRSEANPAYGCEDCRPPDRCVNNFCVPGTPMMQPTEPQPDAAGTAGTEAMQMCEPGSSEFCYEGPDGTDRNPPCLVGRRICSEEGIWGPCLDQITPIEESCNNVDDDCDGMVDELLTSGAQVCVEGEFVCQTPSMSVAEVCDGADNDCDGATDEGFDLASDRENCGACGAVCAESETCCDGECVDTASDEAHCGRCGMQCRRNTTCCGGGCVDTATDVSHCGACGERCAGGMGCCGGKCVDTQTDRDHCGPFCLNCAEGEACCFGSCANLDSFQHCGSCERVCSLNEQCCDRQCTTGACAQ